MKRLVVLLFLVFIPLMSKAAPGPYIEGAAGYAEVSPENDNFTDSFFSAVGGFGARVSGGYLWGDNNFNYGFESGLFYGPNLKDNTSFFGFDKEDIKFRALNVDLLGVLKYTFNNGIALFTKGGAAYTYQQLTIDSSVNINNNNYRLRTIDTSGNKFAPEIAVGIGYQFNPNMELNLTANAVLAGDSSYDNPAALNRALMLGFAYHFA